MEIVKTPNPLLKNKTRDIKKVDTKIKRLIQKLRVALAENNALGIAAPQIGADLNIAVIGFEPTEKQLKEDPKLTPVPKMVLINPKIIWHSKEKQARSEGCLSVEGGRADVPRFQKIHIEYLDEKGKRCKYKAKSFVARVIQHEIDHLNGRIITDYECK